MQKDEINERIRNAIKWYWETRNTQSARSRNDQGLRTAVTGGKQMDGFVEIVKEIAISQGLQSKEIFYKSKLELPGYFRPEKKWDIVIVVEKKLLLAVEFKSQASSFGNNFNNRVEEAVGSATDLWTAYREGAIPSNPKPWLGYLTLLVETEQSIKPVQVREPHFQVFPEFKSASYADRYIILLEKLIRERLYDSSSLIMTAKDSNSIGEYNIPNENLSPFNFFTSLESRLSYFQQTRS